MCGPQPGSTMHLKSGLFCLALIAASTAAAIEPRQIASASRVKADNGAVRLSVQAQVQQMGTIHLWFLREGGDPARSQDVLKFERKQGVPLMGTNAIDSRPLVYSVPPGRYRLLAYGVACPMLPPPGTFACTQTINGAPVGDMPARRYEGDVPMFEVTAGRLTDAGEFILEARPDAPIDEKNGFEFLICDHSAFKIRVRPTAAPLDAGFQTLATGPAPDVPPGFESRITCRQRPKGATLYMPFAC